MQSATLEYIADGEQAYLMAYREGIRPEIPVSVPQWAQEYRKLSSKSSSEPGDWYNERTPYLVEIMECLSVASTIKDIIFMKGTQVGATECGNNWIGSIIHQTPGPMLFVNPTSSFTEKVSKLRIQPMIDETPVLRERVASARSRDSGNTTKLKEFPGGQLLMSGANSSQEMRGVPIRFLFGDELDEWPLDLGGQGDPERLADRRTTNFPRAKRFKASTPTVEGHSRIAKRFKASDQRYYHVPCPECDHEQHLVWDQMRWQTRKVAEFHCTGCGTIAPLAAITDGEVVCGSCGEKSVATDQNCVTRDTGEITDVWYECAACQFAIKEHQKTALLAAGRWIASNPGPNRAAGFHLSALYSPIGWYSWFEAVTDWIEAQDDEEALKVFWNTVLGLPYSVAQDQPDDDGLRKRAGGYHLGDVPAAVGFLVASVDVQGNRLEVKVKGYGRGEETWLIDYQIIYGNPHDIDVWDALDNIRTKTYRHESGAAMPIVAMAVDSGGHHTHEVYDYCAQRRHVIAVKGASARGKTILGKPTKVDIKFDGKVDKEAGEVWSIGTDTAKSLIYGRLKLESPGPRYMHFPFGLPDDYFGQLTVEQMVARYIRGHKVTDFVKNKGDRNEALDLEVYAYAAALYAGLKRANWDELERRLVTMPRFDPQASAAGDVSQETPVATTPAAPKRRSRVRGRVGS